jgi:hypothetical protein
MPLNPFHGGELCSATSPSRRIRLWRYQIGYTPEVDILAARHQYEI